jgi:membrane protease YdiL (CAAX protease family)
VTVHAVRRLADDRASEAIVPFVVAVAGCAALAARLTASIPAIGVTLAVGVAGALAPTRTDERPSDQRAWITAVAIGVVAFASIRLASALPPPPPSYRMVALAVVAAGAEELFFRRFLYAALLRRGAVVAIAGSALAFALVHVPAYGAGVFPLDLAAGLVLSWQRWATGSWTAPAVSHAAANLMVIL